MLYTLLFLVGLALGWLVQWLLDRRFWAKLRAEDNASDDQLQHAIKQLESRQTTLQQALETAQLDNSRLLARLDTAALHAQEMEQTQQLRQQLQAAQAQLAQHTTQPTDPDLSELKMGLEASVAAAVAEHLSNHSPTPSVDQFSEPSVPATKPAQMNLLSEDTNATTPIKRPKTDSDLQVIKGIGPKIADLLRASELSTFDRIAGASAEDIAAVMENAGPRFRLADTSTWAAQAQCIVDEDWLALAQLQANVSL